MKTKSIYIKSQLILLLIILCLVPETSVEAQIPDPDLGLRAEWMRGSYGLNWKPVRTQNAGSMNYEIQNFEGLTSIAIYSLLGKKILMKDIESSVGQIDISRLSRGFYIFKIHGGSTMTTRFVIE